MRAGRQPGAGGGGCSHSGDMWRNGNKLSRVPHTVGMLCSSCTMHNEEDLTRPPLSHLAILHTCCHIFVCIADGRRAGGCRCKQVHLRPPNGNQRIHPSIHPSPSRSIRLYTADTVIMIIFLSIYIIFLYTTPVMIIVTISGTKLGLSHPWSRPCTTTQQRNDVYIIYRTEGDDGTIHSSAQCDIQKACA